MSSMATPAPMSMMVRLRGSRLRDDERATGRKRRFTTLPAPV